MFVVNVNGVDYEVEDDIDLMPVLRDQIGLKSVKDGCNQGSCGTCTVIIDGKAVRACTQKVKRLAGKKVVTIEGFSKYEQDVFAYSFAKYGSAQCGYCIPGMVLAGKALLDTNTDPTRDEVKHAIRTNLCRCTGYEAIEDGIIGAGELLREQAPVPEVPEKVGVGMDVFRVDAIEKTLGTGVYADDIVLDDMAYGRNVFTPHPHARILAIDTSEAKAMPGVIAVFTAEDIPGSRYVGHLSKDWPGMIAVGEETKCIGDTLALVVAETKAQATEAMAAVKVDYEELPVITSPAQAMADDAHQIHGEGFLKFGNFTVPERNLCSHEDLRRGDVEAGFAASAHISEHTFDLPMQEHAFMETEAAVGIPDGDGIMVISGGQGIYDEYHEVAEYLGLPLEKVRIRSALVGGGFGGKEDMSVQHQAALCAFLTKRPVKFAFTRQESFNYHPKRHAMTIHMKLGCDENGIFQAMEAHLVSDTGAYASLGGPVLQRACTHAGGPYAYENVHVVGDAYYTNNPPAGAFRGFGVTQSAAVIECLVNDLAVKTGLSGWEIRYRNAIRPGLVLPNGQIAGTDTGFVETLEAVKEDFERYEADPEVFVGIASALKNAGIGVGLSDTGRCNLEIIDGKVHIRSSAAGIGQGLTTVLLQVVAETTSLNRSDIVVDPPDTSNSPDAGTTTASRQTTFTGEAARLAAEELTADLDAGNTLADLEGKLYKGEFDYATDPLNSTKHNPISHISYGFSTQLFVINADGEMTQAVAATDAGTIINPMTCRGQVLGGIAMGIGYGLTEDFVVEGGIPQVKLAQLGMVKSNQMPPVKSVFVSAEAADHSYGAKGVGEITCCMAAPALQNAYFKKDGNFRTKMPLDDTFYRKPKRVHDAGAAPARPARAERPAGAERPARAERAERPDSEKVAP